jgi:hypothetical protein
MKENIIVSTVIVSVLFSFFLILYVVDKFIAVLIKSSYPFLIKIWFTAMFFWSLLFIILSIFSIIKKYFK